MRAGRDACYSLCRSGGAEGLPQAKNLYVVLNPVGENWASANNRVF